MTQHANPDRDVDALRGLPAVHEIVSRLESEGWSPRIGRAVVRRVAREAIGACRERVAKGALADVDLASILQDARRRAAAEDRPALGPAINATGVLLHTGLGRAALAARAADVLRQVGAGHAPVEVDPASGARGTRTALSRSLLTELTGAESATVVNNAAAALALTLAVSAHGREVIVSRGELVEIGGSFRIPEIIEAGGATLREVGTTNRTRAEDYERAIDGRTGAILKVHCSNFRIEGFTHDASIAELASLARARSIPLVHDIGSGLLTPLAQLPSEPDATGSIAAGADAVLFSGDKLLGGPQSGIIVGRHVLIERIEAHPLMRALRVDKLTLCALMETLRLHRDADLARGEIPVLRAIVEPVKALQARAAHLADSLSRLDHARATVVETTAFLGGGSNPAEAMPSVGVEITSEAMNEHDLARALRLAVPGVWGRLRGGAVLLDLRSVLPEQDAALCSVVSDVLSGGSADADVPDRPRPQRPTIPREE
ncbi:MAG: L-seryl-tRNA(Sec) selenium transferase [Phycisphaeraceae bacterium]|nr:L-seryl-tRNA(Sec) selenium transferase [Phycisphaeraceae bacterium]